MKQAREQPRVFADEIRIPYKWTAGAVIGATLASLRDTGRMLAARCPRCVRTWCPPLDVCPGCHGVLEAGDLVPVGPEGTVRSWTRVETATWNPPAEPALASPAGRPWGLAAVRLDGADTDLLLPVTDAALQARMAVGLRVRLVPRTERTGSILDVELAAAGKGDDKGDILLFEEKSRMSPLSEPIAKVRGEVAVPYRWSYGRVLERFFEGTRECKLYGAPCTACGRVILPPTSVCGSCYAPTSEDWVQVGPGATVTGFTTVYLEFPGQPKAPPYTYAHLRLDGTHTEFFGIIEDCAPEDVQVGMRVEPVWAQERHGDLHDIRCFRPERSSSDGA